MLFVNPFSKYIILYISSAFEALLNLSAESIRQSFELGVSTLCGQKTKLLSRWCKKFYDYRSAIIHGRTDWSDEEKEVFMVGNNQSIPYSRTARELFSYCLNRKLFLSGYLSEDYHGKLIYLDKLIK